METDLAAIKATLGDMSDADLDALIDTTYKVEQIAPGLLAWLDTACVWCHVYDRSMIHNA